MDRERKREVHQMLESFHCTDNGDLDSEKTAVIQELLMEVERLEKGWSEWELVGDSLAPSGSGGGKHAR
jgi:hypothetical protein